MGKESLWDLSDLLHFDTIGSAWECKFGLWGQGQKLERAAGRTIKGGWSSSELYYNANDEQARHEPAQEKSYRKGFLRTRIDTSLAPNASQQQPRVRVRS